VARPRVAQAPWSPLDARGAWVLAKGTRVRAERYRDARTGQSFARARPALLMETPAEQLRAQQQLRRRRRRKRAAAADDDDDGDHRDSEARPEGVGRTQEDGGADDDDRGLGRIERVPAAKDAATGDSATACSSSVSSPRSAMAELERSMPGEIEWRVRGSDGEVLGEFRTFGEAEAALRRAGGALRSHNDDNHQERGSDGDG
jgi:hypothetical protein